MRSTSVQRWMKQDVTLTVDVQNQLAVQHTQVQHLQLR